MANPDFPIVAEAQWLREYGPWALVVVCFSTIIYLFAALNKARDAHAAALEAHTDEIKSLNAEHKREMEVILNRLIETSTTQVREYHVLAEKISAVVDSLSRRLDNRRGSQG